MPLYPKGHWESLNIWLRDYQQLGNRCLLAYYLADFNRESWQLAGVSGKFWETILTALAAVAAIAVVGFILYP